MKSATATGPHTFEDFCFLVKDGQKADLIDGVIYMASPENIGANEVFIWLAGVLAWYVEERELAGFTVRASPCACRSATGPSPTLSSCTRTASIASAADTSPARRIWPSRSSARKY